MGILLGTSKLKSEGACTTHLRKGYGGFHYNQVGNVMPVSNNSGNLETRVDQDAFPWRAEASSEGGGNVLASWQSGQWASDSASAGWHHNTKELDGGTGLVNMYQRWYLPETGTFVSKAPYPPMVEHPYGFGMSRPTSLADERGEIPGPVKVCMIICGASVGISPGAACRTCITSCLTAVGGTVGSWPGAAIGGVSGIVIANCVCDGNCPPPPPDQEGPEENPCWPHPCPPPWAPCP